MELKIKWNIKSSMVSNKHLNAFSLSDVILGTISGNTLGYCIFCEPTWVAKCPIFHTSYLSNQILLPEKNCLFLANLHVHFLSQTYPWDCWHFATLVQATFNIANWSARPVEPLQKNTTLLWEWSKQQQQQNIYLELH